MSVTRLEIAHHEAGHAVMAQTLGARCRGLTVEDARGEERDDEREAGATARILLAGIAAERRYREGRGEVGDERGTEEDATEAAWWCSLVGFDPEVVAAEAEAVIDARWPTVERVAKAALGAGRLSGSEVTALIEGRPGAGGQEEGRMPKDRDIDIARSDQYGVDAVRLTRDGEATGWDGGVPFRTPMYRDAEGHQHYQLPPEVRVRAAMTPPVATATGEDVTVRMTGALGSELAKAITALGARLDEGRTNDSAGTTAALEKLAVAMERVAAGYETLAHTIVERPVVVRVTVPEVRAGLQVPKVRRKVTRDLLDRIDGIIVEPEEG